MPAVGGGDGSGKSQVSNDKKTHIGLTAKCIREVIIYNETLDLLDALFTVGISNIVYACALLLLRLAISVKRLSS